MPHAVQVSGATGHAAATINGLYRPVAGEGVGGKPVYKKDGADNWIEYRPGRDQWQVKAGSDKGTDVAYMCSLGAQKEAGVVEEATAGWQVYDSTTKVWSEQAGVRVVRCVYSHKETRKTTLENPELSFLKFIDLRPYEHVLRGVVQALRTFLVSRAPWWCTRQDWRWWGNFFSIIAVTISMRACRALRSKLLCA